MMTQRQATDRSQETETMTTKTTEHKTGYHVWTYGIRSWHRTLDGAHRKAMSAQNWCSDVQIIDVATGERV